MIVDVTEQNWDGGVNNILLLNEPTFMLRGSPPCTRFALPAARERHLSVPEIGEKELFI